jgi:hypothetical protein
MSLYGLVLYSWMSHFLASCSAENLSFTLICDGWHTTRYLFHHALPFPHCLR